MGTVKEMTNENYGNYFEIENKSGVILRVSPQGARALDLILPVDGGRDILVGFDTIAEHQAARYFAATIGPVAGRIAGHEFTIDGETYTTDDNDSGSTLHGGFNGYDTKTWAAEPFTTDDSAGVVFTYQQPDGDNGFPGNVTAKATYVLTDENEYKFILDGTTDKPTLLNLTNHGYYNLTGSAANPIDEHELTIAAENVAETDDAVLTTGRILPVAGTKFDFVKGHKIGATLLDDPFVLDPDAKEKLVLTSPDKKVSIVMETTAPAVVIFTTREAQVGPGKHGGIGYHGGIAIEPQGLPGAEKYDGFGSILVTPEQPFHEETTFKLEFK